MVEWLASVATIPFWADFASMLLCLSILFGYNLFVAGEAYATARGLRDYVPGQCNQWWVYVLCLLISVGSGLMFNMLLSRSYDAYTAPSASMFPTIKVDDHFMVEMLSPDDEVARGDIVIFLFPEDESVHFVKRVIGLPGDTLEIRRQVIYVNGTPLDEPYVQHTSGTIVQKRDTLEPVSLGPDEYFVMGDNREDSYDSRWWGPVKRASILGRAKFVYLPGGFGSDQWADRFGQKVR